jgi:glucose-6-phosphate isomerase
MSLVSEELKERVSPEIIRKFDEAIRLGFIRKIPIKKVDLSTGEISDPDAVDDRRIKDMKGYFQDEEARSLMDPETVVYRVYRKIYPEISYGITEIFPGKVGCEYFMTKGHFHKRIEAPGIYLCLKGLGIAVLQHKDEAYPSLIAPFEKGTIALMAPYYAHRIVNIGDENLIFIGFSATDSGFMYGPLEKKGFKYLIVERENQASFLINPNYCR